MKHYPKFVCMLLAALVLCFGLSGVAFSQEITGSIVGTVKDANGAAVKGATVTITGCGTADVTIDGDTESVTMDRCAAI